MSTEYGSNKEWRKHYKLKLLKQKELKEIAKLFEKYTANITVKKTYITLLLKDSFIIDQLLAGKMYYYGINAKGEIQLRLYQIQKQSGIFGD